MGGSWKKYMLWILLVLFLGIARASYVESCLDEERIALLDLDSYLRRHDHSVYETFGGIAEGEKDKYNCCSWRRVKCKTTTQHVVHLDLSEMLFDDYGAQKSWVFNVTVFEPFRQLTSLDLSYNGICGLVDKDGSERLPTLKNLQSLVLFGNFVHGKIFLSNLTSLKTLNLTGWMLRETSLQGLEDLTELEELDLSHNRFGESIFQSLCVLKNLSVLKLAYNNEYNNDFISVLPSCLHGMASLQILDLSHSKLNGMFQDIMPSNLASLRYLDLSDNNLEGNLSLSSFANHNNLHLLDLSRNHLQVQTEDSSWRPSFQLQHLGLQSCSLNQPNRIVPKFLSEQDNLRFIDLSENHLVGPFPTFIMPEDLRLDTDNRGALASYARRSLERLVISGNNFHGELPENIGFIFPGLKLFNASRCHFGGPIPTSIGHMSQLEVLDLSFNNFSGELPRQLVNDLPQLSILILNDNHLEGKIIPDYMNLTGLTFLKLRNNHFGGTINDALRKSSRLWYFDISNNTVTGSIPRWIGQFSELGMLSVSKNAMEGQIPTEICKLPFLIYLYLSENNFNGSIPSCPFDLTVLILGHNKLTGGIPSSLSSALCLNTLDLRDNQLSGGIPLWINKLQWLEILLLAGNNFIGQIPHQLCDLQYINLLDLSRNQLSGTILTCLGNMSFGSKALSSIEASHEVMTSSGYGSISTSFGVAEIDDLLVKNLYLAYVGFDLSYMSVLHLSNNNFSGIIPPEMGNLRHVHSINLSHNCLDGSIPNNLSNLEEIESIDLSYNNLSGVIPYQLVQLYSLETFNVSYNNLTGITPEAGQFGHFDETSYLGNPRLCVSLLSKSCSTVVDNDAPPTTSTTPQEDGKGLDMEDLLWTFGATFSITFMATILVLSINRQWREAFFDFVEWHLLW